MIKTTTLPEEFVTGVSPLVEKLTIEGIDEIQQLNVHPWTTINMHGHDNQWEVWVWPLEKKAYVCLKGEKHRLVNQTDSMLIIIAIKGHKDYTFDDLAEIFFHWGYSIFRGSIVVK